MVHNHIHLRITAAFSLFINCHFLRKENLVNIKEKWDFLGTFCISTIIIINALVPPKD